MASSETSADQAGAPAQEGPLHKLYVQIEYSDSPHDVLGVNPDSSVSEVRNAFLSLALSVHPDKARNDKLKELHTSLFQQLQAAYEEVLSGYIGDRDKEQYVSHRIPKRLPDTEASLHARNCDFREALRKERERVIAASHAAKLIADEQAARQAAKDERLAPKQEAMDKACEEILARKQKKAEERALQTEKRKKRSAMKNAVPAFEWDGQGESSQPTEGAKKWKTSKRPLRNKPTEMLARKTLDEKLCDWSLSSVADIQSRWDKQLLQGGTAGSVSLSQKKQRDNNAEAQIQRYIMTRIKVVDAIERGAYLPGNTTFCNAVREELLHQTFVVSQWSDEAKGDKILSLMDSDVKEQHFLEKIQSLMDADVREQHLLENIPQVYSVSLASFAITEK